MPTGEDNLVINARDRLRAAFPLADCPPVSINLEKNMPIASGLGGGSIDAAATLKALASIWELATTKSELAQPDRRSAPTFPCAWRPSRCLPPASAKRSPSFRIFRSSAWCWSIPACRSPPRRSSGRSRITSIPACCPSRPAFPRQPRRLKTGHTRNDLEKTARAMRQVDDALHELGLTGALLSRMSGSGATCFGLFENDLQMQGAARHILRERPGWFVVATRSSGPSHVVSD